ncbi:MAG: hypothetical protein M4D80_05345 [Myxococcota bacterium]|nr:hypothetical protein [Deltaproteobacteria bacterium]MDQ3334562.1 hypothetical protein [Myxococcota bacterium]
MLEPRRELPKLTDRYPLGNGLEVGPFCLGLVGEAAIVPAAFEAGINFFFVSADMHWPLYEQTRRGLELLVKDKPAARDQIVLGLVSYVTQPEFCWVPFQEALEEMPGLGRVDVTIAGGSYGEEIGRRLGIYKQHKDAAYLGVRGTGATFHDRAAMLPILDEKRVDIAFVRYNPVHAGAAKDLFPNVRDEHPLLFNFKSTFGHMEEHEYQAVGVGADFWRPHQTDYYRFALTQPAIDGILCALPTVGAVRDLADALAKGPLDEDDHQYLLDLGELARGRATVKS